MIDLAQEFDRRAAKISREVTRQALEFLQLLFAAGSGAVGSAMAGQAEQGVGQPEVVAASANVLAQDLITELASFRD